MLITDYFRLVGFVADYYGLPMDHYRIPRITRSCKARFATRCSSAARFATLPGESIARFATQVVSV